MSKSGYYDWLKREPSQRVVVNSELDKVIRRIYSEHAGRYGYRRVRDDLLDLGLQTSKERVRRRMKCLNLRGIQRHKFKCTTDSYHRLPIMQNVLNQDFEFCSMTTTLIFGHALNLKIKKAAINCGFPCF